MSDPTTVDFDAPDIDDTVAKPRRKKLEDGITRVDSRTAKKVRIIISKTQTERSDVYVNVNGTDFLIKRGVEVEVPDFIVEVLRNSVESRLDEDGNTWNEAPCYPFSVVG